MRPLLAPVLLAALVALAGCVSTRYDRARPYPGYARVGSSGGQAQYAVCHKGRNTLTLPEPAVDAHMRHGDYFGACGRANRDRHDDHYRRDDDRGRGNQGRGRGR
ncbi:MAG: hypothetical protein R3181_14855 [Rubricoccaceae bacterium]|nr:hypothetical protein [Rubricoccaceae bacterium]